MFHQIILMTIQHRDGLISEAELSKLLYEVEIDRLSSLPEDDLDELYED